MKGPGRSRSIVVASALAMALACAHVPDGGGIELAGAVDFAMHDDRLAFRLEPTRGGVRVENGEGALLAALHLEGVGLAIEDASGHPLGTVVPPSGGSRGFRILAPDAETTLVELRREPDGDLKLFDSREELLGKAKRRDYGFKVVDRDGDVESRIRITPGKISVRDGSGVTFLSCRDRLPADAAAALFFERLRFEYAAGLSVALAHWAAAPD